MGGIIVGGGNDKIIFTSAHGRRFRGLNKLVENDTHI